MTMTLKDKKSEIVKGAKRASPIILGYVFVGMAFGIVSRSSGISVLDTSLMSLLVYAGASQFVAVGLIEKGIGVLSIIFTTFLVNSRHLLMSASLSPYFKRLKSWKSAMLAFGVTDETFVLNSTELSKKENKNFYFILGLHGAAYTSWVLSTVAGALLGNYIVNPNELGLNFTLPAMFIALLIIQITNRIDLIVCLVAASISVILLPFISDELILILSTIFAASLGVVLKNG